MELKGSGTMEPAHTVVDPELEALIVSGLTDQETSWSIGSFGAIGEFHYTREESKIVSPVHGGGQVLTERGGIRVQLPETVRVSPYESLRRDRRVWSQGVNLCQPSDVAMRSRRSLLTEIGPDAQALNVAEVESVLFDLGLGIPHVDVCVRTADPELLRTLRANQGTRILEPENPAMAAIMESSPHRVFISNLGRIEVFQQIGSPARGVPTPHGPHTHVLPKLLKAERTHAANVDVPDGFLPCLTFYPPNPVVGDGNGPEPFSHVRHDAFQDLMEAYGNPEIIALKQQIVKDVRSGQPPVAPDALDRHQRTCIRIALRQMYWSLGPTPSLGRWQTAFEPQTDEDDPAGYDTH